MKISKLSKSQRQQLIVDKLKEFPAIRVSELSRDINVSTETIRRDLDELESQGLISRTYGGATPAMNHEPTFRQRQQMHPHQYDLIARSASEIVKNGEVLIIGSSVTTLQLAVRLAAEKKDLCVFTDSYAIASALSSNPSFKIHVCPGLYNDDESSVYGPETINYLNRIYVDRPILGASGLTLEGVANADLEIGETYRTMIKRASSTMIVADHSKISRNAITTYATWNEISTLVIDEAPYDEELLIGLKHGNVEVIVAGKGGFNNSLVQS